MVKGTNDRLSQYERMKAYRVKADSIEEFKARYMKPNRYELRGEEYMKASLQGAKNHLAKYGYDLITHHDSITGEMVTYYPTGD